MKLRRIGCLDALMAAVGIMVVLIAIMVAFPIMAGDHEPSTRRHCMSNLKQIATVSLIYRDDFDDHLPPSNWGTQFIKYRLPDTALNCPDVLQPRPQYGYALNETLVGMSAKKYNEATTVAFFETDILALDAVQSLTHRNRDRHNGRSSILAYLDSHVKAVAKESNP